MITTLLILALFGAAASGAAFALIYIHHLRFEKQWANLENELLKAGSAVADVMELKDFYDFMSGEIREQLEEAHRQKDRARVQKLQRMKDRLETLKARVIDRPIKKAQEQSDVRQSNKKRRSNKKK